MYTLIFFKSKALEKDKKELKKENDNFRRVIAKIQMLSENPFGHSLDIKKLKNSEESTFRLRVGNFRVLYDVDSSNKNIIIYRIKKRKEGYS